MKLKTQMLLLFIVPLLLPTLFLVASSGLFPLLAPTPTDQPPGFLAAVPIGFSAVAIVLVITSFRRLDKSLEGLIVAHKKIAEGHLESPVRVLGAPEITSLARSLEEMRLKLKEERERKSFLMLGLSHDFRTPIGLIKGYAEALEDAEGLELGAEDRKKYLSIIKAKTLQMDRLVDRWLSLVRLETGEYTVLFRETRVRPFLEQLFVRFAQDAEPQKLTFHSSVVISESLEVLMDPELIERALENLFSNSWKHGGPGCVLTWEARQEAHGLVLTLEDDGPGIDPKDLSLVWEPFFRGRNPGGHGFGLGLSIVKTILSAHGFAVSVANREEGQGVRFTIILPLG